MAEPPAWVARLPKPVTQALRSSEFFGRVGLIYGSYKLTQLRAALLRVGGRGREQAAAQLWDAQHTWAGEAMYDLAISLRGFYLKAGQFLGARSDFVPDQICAKLCLLQDRVPPMAPERAKQVVCEELGISDLGEVFEWIDLEPIGSASISQVHKAQLRRFPRQQLRKLRRRERGLVQQLTVAPGDTAWSVCNSHGISLAELAACNREADLDALEPGTRLRVPVVLGLEHYTGGSRAAGAGGGGQQHGDPVWLSLGRVLGGQSGGSSGGSSSASSSHGSSDASAEQAGCGLPGLHSPAAAAVAHAAASGQTPDGGLVAVKVQYPGALQTMTLDLANLARVSAFLQHTELRFDLLSAVREMQAQIHLEFDFMREARVMDTIAQHLQGLSSQVVVPRSVPGLVSQRLMVMSFMDGLPLMQLRDKVAHLPAWKRDKAARRILGRVSLAYGQMLLGEGLFQADGHPGNILVQEGGRVALLDYGQSKQLGERDRAAFADLVLAMHGGDEAAISECLSRLAVRTSKDDPSLRASMAYGMFDTRGKVDPFDAASPIKQAAIESFPPDLFFVLRVVQLLRGMANGMGISDFSTADQWAPLARQSLAQQAKRDRQRRLRRRLQRPQPLADLASLASPLRLTV